MLRESEEEPQWKIAWSVLEQRVLEFISVKHLRFLANFNRLFREFDRDSDGRLSEAEFRNLARKVALIVERDLAAEQLLVKLDPANTGSVNYSGIVFVLSNEFLELAPVEVARSQSER